MLKINKATEYLITRLDSLNDEKIIIEGKKQKINYEINGIRHKIQEILDNVDTAYEVFSPRTKNSSFTKGEIDNLKIREKELVELYNEYDNQLIMIDRDIETIKDALEEDGFENQGKEDNFLKESPLESYENEETLYGVKILEKQELERQRIARELHDSSVQVLTSLIHKCEICSKVMEKDSIRAKLELEVMAKSLRDTIDEMRTIIFDLRPMSFDDLGIDVTLKKVIDKMKKNTEMNINLKIEGEPVELPATVSLTFIRIIQEAVTNAIKYSYGDNVFVSLQYEIDNILIVVEDDGIGFDVESTKALDKGFGISMMKERVYLLAGNIEIQSKDGKGTRIEINIPIE